MSSLKKTLSLEETLSSIRETGLFSDLTLCCQSKNFAIHRCIVCLQSEYFKKALTGDFKEASSRIINLDDDPFIVEKIVQYLYGANYDDDSSPSEGRNNIPSESGNDIASGSRNPAEINAQVYIAADRYAIPDLKTLAIRKLESYLEKDWQSGEFISVLEIAYDWGGLEAPGLRGLLMRFVCQHLSGLRAQKDFLAVLKNYQEFSYDCSTMMMEKVLELEGYGY
ncbi:hypothetical protein AJ80_10017 [Polytolypa hystricis UAMH7299]|uniref:BTB domain-containing protein n=1 Tax=Polytolypa hystricis (strain UAMH7299) TaxID=1447883 RepID=A0A2B7WEY0_POLH7|nr:hypothetical protein AJ80_10017 [Polytolypa hystricis UAMH7299]